MIRGVPADPARASVPAPRELGRVRDALERLRRGLALAGTPRSEGEASSDLEQRFIARCARAVRRRACSSSARCSRMPGRSTMHRDWVPHAAEFLGTDIEAGAGRGHRRRPPPAHRRWSGAERFDVILSCSTFEHLKYPHRWPRTS